MLARLSGRLEFRFSPHAKYEREEACRALGNSQLQAREPDSGWLLQVRRLFLELTLFFHEEATNHKRVHTGAEERAHRVGRRVHDGFAAQIE